MPHSLVRNVLPMQVEPPVTAARGGQGASLLWWTQVIMACPQVPFLATGVGSQKTSGCCSPCQMHVTWPVQEDV